MIKKEKLLVKNQILMFAGAEAPYMALGIKVAASAGVQDGTNKVVRAGTPLAGDIVERMQEFTKASATDAKGVLLHDVDVTDGAGNGTLLIFGAVNLNRLDTATKALIVDGVKTALDGKVLFLKG